MSQTPPPPTVRIRRRFRVSAERVFDAWLNPATAARWLFATEEGRIVRIDLDPRVGGRFVVIDRRPQGDVEHEGEYLEIQRPSRLVFTFGLPQVSPQRDRVTVEIVSVEDGCQLTLTHVMAPEWAEHLQRTETGWTKMLERLAISIDDAASVNTQYGRFTAPGEVRFVRLLPGPIERVWAYLTDPEKRATWFAGGPMELRAGGRAELVFRHANLAPDETPRPGYEEAHDPGMPMAAIVTECEPPRRLSFTFGGVEVGKSPEVTFELTPQDDRVLLVLTQRRAASREELVDVSGGWHAHLAILLARLEDTSPPGIWSMSARLEPEYAERLTAVSAALSST